MGVTITSIYRQGQLHNGSHTCKNFITGTIIGLKEWSNLIYSKRAMQWKVTRKLGLVVTTAINLLSSSEPESHFLQLRIEPGYPKWLPRRIPLLKYRFPKILLTESKMESENYFRNSFNKQPMCFYCCDKIIMNELQLLWILWMNFKIPMNGNSFMCINKRRMI